MESGMVVGPPPPEPGAPPPGSSMSKYEPIAERRWRRAGFTGRAGRASDVADARAGCVVPPRAEGLRWANPPPEEEEEEEDAAAPCDARRQGATGARARIAVAMSVAAVALRP
mmetsp:Transcript_12979/g.58560  ORF Transcript_12979/g.58560 Transcript_12979/m.58560 type:complete len:113 (-) Transcript_12979:84-422(-)